MKVTTKVLDKRKGIGFTIENFPTGSFFYYHDRLYVVGHWSRGWDNNCEIYEAITIDLGNNTTFWGKDANWGIFKQQPNIPEYYPVSKIKIEAEL